MKYLPIQTNIINIIIYDNIGKILNIVLIYIRIELIKSFDCLEILYTVSSD